LPVQMIRGPCIAVTALPSFASLFRFGRVLPVTIATRIMCMSSRLCRTRGVAFSLAAVESGLRE
jgi:hypothetical protein